VCVLGRKEYTGLDVVKMCSVYVCIFDAIDAIDALDAMLISLKKTNPTLQHQNPAKTLIAIILKLRIAKASLSLSPFGRSSC
jgi:hypothetical protein